ncbi:hypothetical protein G6F24_016964 [Rhizopus arrhizus]|nr:hypothetical protein G6F24_016964 [Rhizopus arrhizus]
MTTPRPATPADNRRDIHESHSACRAGGPLHEFGGRGERLRRRPRVRQDGPAGGLRHPDAERPDAGPGIRDPRHDDGGGPQDPGD